MGILGGVLGGIGARGTPASPTAALASKREDGGVRGSAGTKEVWQGGRWRRQGTAEAEEEKVSLLCLSLSWREEAPGRRREALKGGARADWLALNSVLPPSVLVAFPPPTRSSTRP
jgi:hypothetical protein